MATTGQGPAWMTVTGVSVPVSSSKTCVMPSFLPTIPFIRCTFRHEARAPCEPTGDTLEPEGGPRRPRERMSISDVSQLDLDVDAGRQVKPHQLVDGLRGRRVDVDQ